MTEQRLLVEDLRTEESVLGKAGALRPNSPGAPPELTTSWVSWRQSPEPHALILLYSPTHMSNYRRRLPHVQPVGKELFLTFRLHGSLPPFRYAPSDKKLTAGEAFVWIDRYLDTTGVGPLFLKQAPIAGLVVRAIRFGADDLGHYKLQAFVVMPNHVHLLVLPMASPRRFMQSLKGFTAREANKVLPTRGFSRPQLRQSKTAKRTQSRPSPLESRSCGRIPASASRFSDQTTKQTRFHPSLLESKPGRQNGAPASPLSERNTKQTQSRPPLRLNRSTAHSATKNAETNPISPKP